MIKEGKGDRVFQILVYILVTFAMIVTLYPILYALSASFSDPLYILRGEITLLPKDFNLNSYIEVFREKSIWKGYLNTIIYTVVGTFINLAMTSVGAYVLSRKDFYGRNVITMLIVFTMFFEGGIIPNYLLIKNLHMLDSIWAMVIPKAIIVYNLILMRTFFQGLPFELHESAVVDGASDFQIFIKIILPLSKPILAVMTLFYAVDHWNEFFDALIYLTDRDKYPLQLILREILIQNDTGGMTEDVSLIEEAMAGEGIKYAVVIIASIPMLVLYPFLQKYFIKGVMIGSLKG